MPVNADKTMRWKADVAASVDLYNDWFLRFAPRTYRDTRIATTQQVEQALHLTANLTNVTASVLAQQPAVLPILRMSTAPPIARDRLIGLAGVRPGIVKAMENRNPRLPHRLSPAVVLLELEKIAQLIMRLADPDVFTWLSTTPPAVPGETEVYRASTIVADRLCGANADPIVRNEQERRQLASIRSWLEARGYRLLTSNRDVRFDAMEPGTFTFRLNVPVRQGMAAKPINIPVDAVVMPHDPVGGPPLLIEAKSAGDFTNPNKRRKEEATKYHQLRETYGDQMRFILFLNGYFDAGYLGYEASEGIDWVWEHRIDDLAQFGL